MQKTGNDDISCLKYYIPNERMRKVEKKSILFIK